MSRKSNRISYSILELASVAAGNTINQTFEKSLDLARQAEQMGYKRFWLAEHHNMISIASSATAVLIGHIAGGTNKIRVGSGGIMLPNHSPLIVAEQFGTLGSLYPDRIDLGLGRAPGTDQVTATAIRSDRMTAVYQFPDEVETVMKYFSTDNASSAVRATVAEGVELPVYILGSSTDSAHVAARMGLPYAFASHFAPGYLHQALEIYHKEFQPSRFLDHPYTIAGINVVVAETNEQAKDLSTSMIRMILGVLTSKMDYLQAPEKFTPEYQELLDNPSFQRMMKYAFIGDAEHVKAQTQKFLDETGVDELIVASNIYDHQDRVDSFRLFSEIMKDINTAQLVK